MSVEPAQVAEKFERGGEDSLTDEEKRFLQDRGVQLSTPVPVVFNLPGGGTVSNDPMALLSNYQEQQQVDLEAEVQRRVQVELARIAASTVTEIQHEQVVTQTPHTGTANPNAHPTGSPVNPAPEDLEDAEEGDEEEDYEEGWNNDERRAELARRNLPTDGNKDELIARLLESDSGEEKE